MELKILFWGIKCLVVTMHLTVSNGKSQSSNLQTGSNIGKCSEKCIDSCDIINFMDGVDKVHKEMQLQTQGQLANLDNKMTSILLRLDPCSSNPCIHGQCSKSQDDFICTCNAGYIGKTCDNKVTVSDCYDLRYQANETRDGVYQVQLWKSKKYIEVYCDMTTDGGGWTVFQNRYNGNVDFYQSFKQYEDGFGDVYEEFWLGLQYIQELTSQDRTEVRLDLTSHDNSHWYETYSDFRLSSTSEYYLHLSKGVSSSANATYRMMLYNGYAFTTPDRDFDLDTETELNTEEDYNCGIVDHGGWWYGYCKANHFANLNGEYCKPGEKSKYNDGYGGMIYRDFKGMECLKSSKIMMRRVFENIL